MPSFSYVAREAGSGREIRNSLDAQNEQAAVAALLNKNLLVMSIQEKVGKKGKTAGGTVSLADLVVFTRQLATMIDAGLAMVQSLQALAEQTSNKVMRDTIKDICTRVESSDSFSDALGKHPKTFSRLYVCMVAAGERGGLLSEILSRLATYLENTARLRKKVKSAMMYPVAVTVVALGITVFLLVKVVPVFGGWGTSFSSILKTRWLVSRHSHRDTGTDLLAIDRKTFSDAPWNRGSRRAGSGVSAPAKAAPRRSPPGAGRGTSQSSLPLHRRFR